MEPSLGRSGPLTILELPPCLMYDFLQALEYIICMDQNRSQLLMAYVNNISRVRRNVVCSHCGMTLKENNNKTRHSQRIDHNMFGTFACLQQIKTLKIMIFMITTSILSILLTASLLQESQEGSLLYLLAASHILYSIDYRAVIYHIGLNEISGK